jgi:uncharacterized protein (TIGR03663 family)
MHNDEGVNAFKFGQLWEQGSYKYDPNEHHGPSLYYAALALGRVTGGPDLAQYSDKRLRMVTVVFGLALLLVLPLLIDGLGRMGTAWAAVFIATSPALVFYSRYFIHETLLVFFTSLLLGAGWRYWRTRRVGWALLAGASLGLMMASKETFIITIGAAVIALGLNHTWNRLLDASGLPVKAAPLNLSHLAVGLVACLIVTGLLFTSFLSNAAGLADAIRTYEPWFKRAGGESPHIHPWYFYFHRLLWFHVSRGPVWTEGLLLILAGIAAVAGFRRRFLGRANASFIRFVALYTFLATAFYSLLPYKTPWCLLTFWSTTALLAGVGAAVLLRSVRLPMWKPAMRVLLLACTAHLCWQSWQQSTGYAADQRNPYVYAQTSPDLLKLVARAKGLADISPERTNLLINVVVPDGDYWPLPWYLRQLKQIDWSGQLASAPVMIVAASLNAHLDEKGTHLMVGYFQLRPRHFLELYVSKELWQEWLAKLPPQNSE